MQAPWQSVVLSLSPKEPPGLGRTAASWVLVSWAPGQVLLAPEPPWVLVSWAPGQVLLAPEPPVCGGLLGVLAGRGRRLCGCWSLWFS